MITRLEALTEYARRYDDHIEKLSDDIEDDPNSDADGWEFQCDLATLLKIPLEIYGLPPMAIEHTRFMEGAAPAFERLAEGGCSPRECRELIAEYDEFLELDLVWIVFGIPFEDLPISGYRSLVAFITEFGTRGFKD